MEVEADEMDEMDEVNWPLEVLHADTYLMPVSCQIVFCSYGPLFPSAQYTIATQFLIPTGQSSIVYLGFSEFRS